MSKIKKIVELEITHLAKNGDGLAFLHAQNTQHPPSTPVEIPFTLPGDVAKVHLLRKRKGVYQGILQEILKAAPERIAPQCIHFGTCGGCRWQNMAYDEQLMRKEAMVKNCCTPFLFGDIEVKPIIPCSPPFGYRNKMEFSFSSNAAKDHFLGLIIDSSRGKVFNLTECHLVNSWFAEGVKLVREWWQESHLDAFHPHKNTGSLRTLTLREGLRTGDRLVMLTVSGNPEYAIKKHDLDNFVLRLKDALKPDDLKAHLSILLRIHQAKKGIPTSFYEMLLHGPDHIREVLYVSHKHDAPPDELRFKISPAAFFQPNTRQAEQLYSTAMQYLDIHENTVVYDLYCGTGTLSLCAAKLAKQVIGIEIAPEATLDAAYNASYNGYNNIEFLTGSVPDVLSRIIKDRSHPLPDVVMVDPPRAGLDPQAIECILTLKPSRILYVSCNPVTQAANVCSLIAAGYQVKIIQPVDQFPQTVHVENIIILTR